MGVTTENKRITTSPNQRIDILTNQLMADEKNKPAPNQNQINIELTEEVAEGIYSNLAMIAHSNSEFVIILSDLCQECPRQRLNQEL